MIKKVWNERGRVLLSTTILFFIVFCLQLSTTYASNNNNQYNNKYNNDRFDKVFARYQHKLHQDIYVNKLLSNFATTKKQHEPSIFKSTEQIKQQQQKDHHNNHDDHHYNCIHEEISKRYLDNLFENLKRMDRGEEPIHTRANELLKQQNIELQHHQQKHQQKQKHLLESILESTNSQQPPIIPIINSNEVYNGSIPLTVCRGNYSSVKVNATAFILQQILEQSMEENNTLQYYSSLWDSPLSQDGDSVPPRQDILPGQPFHCSSDSSSGMNATIPDPHSFSSDSTVFPLPSEGSGENEFDQQSNYHPIRITFDYTYLNTSLACSKQCKFAGDVVYADKDCSSNGSCTHPYVCKASDVVTDQFVRYISHYVFPVTKQILQGIVRVPERQGPLYLNRKIWQSTKGLCGNVQIDPSFLEGSTGIPDTDLLVYVTSRPELSAGYIAYGSPCNFEFAGSDQMLGRPLAGVINFSTSYFTNLSSSTNETYSFQRAVQSSLHEMIHVLGFTNGLYDYYIDSKGEKHTTPIIYDTLTGVNPSNVTVTKAVAKIATPQVVKAARTHYNCSYLNGVELEDCNDTNNACLSAHWESRIAYTELMTSNTSATMPLSFLTLALLQDMGWYYIDPRYAQEFVWGKGEGCNFVYGRCEHIRLGERDNHGYFCGTPSNNFFGCSPDRRGSSVCNVRTTQTLQPAFQHFKQPNRGGLATADYCPFYQLQQPNLPTNQYSFYCTSITSDHRCFMVGNGTTSNLRPLCFAHRCQDQKLELYMDNGNGSMCWYQCPVEGGSIRYQGKRDVYCPPADFFCSPVKLDFIKPMGYKIKSETPFYKEAKFWVPLVAAGGLLVSLSFAGTIVYKKYFRKPSSRLDDSISMKTLN